MMRHVLILGGTGDGRNLAERLAGMNGLTVTLSLAGRTREPAPQAGRLRVGGFGGAEGLTRYMFEQKVEMLVDATHPFAARMSANAFRAAEITGLPLLVLERPQWQPVEGDRWIEVTGMAEAVRALGDRPRRVFLAIGRQEAGAFADAPQHFYVVRSIETPETGLPNAETILARGPFDEADERALLHARNIEIVVAKNSGGGAIYGKIAAARALGLPVVMVRRPGPSGAEVVRTVEEAVGGVVEMLGC